MLERFKIINLGQVIHCRSLLKVDLQGQVTLQKISGQGDYFRLVVCFVQVLEYRSGVRCTLQSHVHITVTCVNDAIIW